MQKLEADFKESGGIFKEWKIGDLFEKQNLRFRKNNFNKDTDVSKIRTNEFNIPLVNAKDGSNGIMYYGRDSDFESVEMSIDIINDGAVSTGNVYPQPQKTGVLYNAYLVKPCIKEVSTELLIFFSQAIQKSIKLKFGYEKKASWERVQEEYIYLPTTTTGKIDFTYMEKYIQLLEKERLDSLKHWLKQNNLADTTLTTEETAAVKKFRNGKIKFKEFRIGDLFEKQNLRFRKNNFNKDTDVSKIRTNEFNIPLVNAKDGNNGIMYYGRDSDFESVEMSIDIINDGAVSTGNVYPQPQKTGILYNAYLVKPCIKEISVELLIFFSQAIQKSIKPKFGYEKKASWERVQEEYISLPVTTAGKIDYNFMEHFICAQQKIALRGLSKIT